MVNEVLPRALDRGGICSHCRLTLVDPCHGVQKVTLGSGVICYKNPRINVASGETDLFSDREEVRRGDCPCPW